VASRRRLRLLIGALAAASVAAAPGAPELERDVAYLASRPLGGRLTGSPGAEKAARYVADAFRQAGLRPLGTSRPRETGAALDGSGYFQPFEFTAGAAEGPGNALSAEILGRRYQFRPGSDFAPSSISGSGRAQGGVVFGGYGVVSRDPARDDYGSLDLRGKIVLLAAGAPGEDPRGPFAEFAGIRHKVFFARERGAAAVLVAAPRESDLPDPSGSRDFRNEGIPVLLLRRSVADAWLAPAGWTLDSIERKLPFGPVPLELSVRAALSAEIVPVRRTAANVAGLLAGSDPKLAGESVIVGAHFDHLGLGGPSAHDRDSSPQIHPGADDNASGVAGLIALARRLSSAGRRPRRSILFVAFSGEELGLLGSAHYVASPLLPIANAAAMINLDMIGRLRADRLMVIGTGSSPRWDPLLEEANRGEGFTIVRSESAFGASDQRSFYDAGIPVLFFYTGSHPDYHRATDTPDKLNYAGEDRIVDLVARCVESIADADVRPGFQQIAASKMPDRLQPRVWFGSVPDAAGDGDGEGVRIAGVRAGSPAERAGLRPGDVVVMFGQYHVRNTQDYIIAIEQHRGGESVPVLVRRGEETRTLEVTLGGEAGEE
jgi:aminopeptidase YwaD